MNPLEKHKQIQTQRSSYPAQPSQEASQRRETAWNSASGPANKRPFYVMPTLVHLALRWRQVEGPVATTFSDTREVRRVA